MPLHIITINHSLLYAITYTYHLFKMIPDKANVR